MDCPCFLPHGTGILKALALPEILHSRHCGGVAEPAMGRSWPMMSQIVQGEVGTWVSDCWKTRWGGSIGTMVKSLSTIKENQLLQGSFLSKAVTGCFPACLCLLLLFQLSYLLFFSASLLPTSEHQIVRHELMGPQQAHLLDWVMVKSQPTAHSQQIFCSQLLFLITVCRAPRTMRPWQLIGGFRFYWNVNNR